MIMSHIAHTSPLMEVWGFITAQNSVWFGEGGGRLDASRISESAGVKCSAVCLYVMLHMQWNYRQDGAAAWETSGHRPLIII